LEEDKVDEEKNIDEIPEFNTPEEELERKFYP